jgi:hypothetical protein
MFDRRTFLKGIGTLVGGIAIEKAIPFNRVWSFPSVIKIPECQIIVVPPELLPVASNIIRGNFAQLMAPGLHEVFTEWIKLKTTDDYETIFKI